MSQPPSPTDVLPLIQRLLQGERLWRPANGAERESLFDAVAELLPGPIGWLPAENGLLANLRAWENLVLPLCYHRGDGPDPLLERRLNHLLGQLGFETDEIERLCASPIGQLSHRRRRLLCGVRAMLSGCRVLLIEAEWLQRLDDDEAPLWQALFEQELPGAGWLVVGHKAPASLWRCSAD
ncbi:hypothetical protein [Chitinimonas lacunae]|uniref:ATP-binding cassette domain-containing protein n=1 Tax=Chitinimonas lacunae TaxID=1963018 RepID=A0ABV8ML32_9NEIS